MNDLRDKLLRLPKRDVHNHLHLGGSVVRLQERYPNAQFKLPTSFAGIEGMIDFIQTSVNSFLHTPQDVLFFMEMALEQCLADNVTYLEASIDIGLERYFENSTQGLIETVGYLIKKYAAKIDFRPEIGINKDYPIDSAYKQALTCMESGLFHSVDLYGEESNQDLSPFVDLYGILKKNGLKTKVHMGEFSGHETIEAVIQLLGPSEIQHGISAARSKKTMQMIMDHGIPLNICPQSNVSLGAVGSMQEHPIRTLFDFGVAITINTDDHLLFGTSITDQLLLLLKHNHFSFEELESIVI